MKISDNSLLFEDTGLVLAQLTRWFEDYNEVHMHQGLKMLSPRDNRMSLMAAFGKVIGAGGI